jgi:hypothetical protein
MKRNFALLFIVFVIASGFAFAGARIQLSANIPFDFYIEDQLLPAGEYNFEMGGNAIIIRSKDGKGIRLLSALNGENINKAEDFLQFNQYGEKRFLTSLAAGSSKALVKITETEREVKAQFEKAQKVILTARK